MRSSTRSLVRLAVAATVAATALAGSAVTTAAPPPGETDYTYYVVNATEHPIVLASYVTQNPYPEWVTPSERIEPGQKFEFGLRQVSYSYSVKVNFDTFDKKGNRIPGGLVEMQLKLDDAGGHTVTRRVACWPGPERTCVPRGWGADYTDTVSFVG